MKCFTGVTPVLAGALASRGYSELTPVQKAVLAEEANGADLLVSAQTGSGKTVAFGLAMAPELFGGAGRLPEISEPAAVVVAPTRELALQVRRELDWLYEPAGGKTASCVGGMDMRRERRLLGEGAHIVVGTPGRLCDHIRRGSLSLASVQVVVLDEADEMLDLGFREDLEFILGAAPAERRTLMFSATVPKPIAALARRFQRSALRISTVQEREQHADIEYRFMTVVASERENAVINTLRHFEAASAMVFCATRDGVKHLAAQLGNRGFAVAALSGELSQNERTQALQSMRDGRARVCVATDVAARGIDLPNLDLVIHADLPMNGETLLHRSGRTGRAGRNGVCVIIAPHNRRRMLERMLRSVGIHAAWMQPPTAEAIFRLDRERLLNDPALSETPSEEELTFARELLSLHGPEHIAAAFLRQDQARRPAPEDLTEETPPSPMRAESRSARRSFEGGVWFRLSVGRKQRAEPRWLLPLICRAGGVEKRHVGSIRILESESRFEISAACAERFIEAAASGLAEKSISITRIEGEMEEAAHCAWGPCDRAPAPRKPRLKSFGKPGAPRGPRPKAGPVKAARLKAAGGRDAPGSGHKA
jgi:ATP-dependent RNA helicase DeaD